MGDYTAPTPEQFADWVTPRAALMRAEAHFGDIGMAERAIDGRLKGGRIRAATLRIHSAALPGSGWVYVIPSNQWEHLAADNGDWWDTGDIRICVPPGPRDSGGNYRHFDVRFDPAGLAALLAGAPPRLQLAAATAASRAGRPRKDFWDDLVIATMQAIWEGGLQPASQADLERWMLDWASRNGHAIGETSVKIPARKILAAREGQKENF